MPTTGALAGWLWNASCDDEAEAEAASVPLLPSDVWVANAEGEGDNVTLLSGTEAEAEAEAARAADDDGSGPAQLLSEADAGAEDCVACEGWRGGSQWRVAWRAHTPE